MFRPGSSVVKKAGATGGATMQRRFGGKKTEMNEDVPQNVSNCRVWFRRLHSRDWSPGHHSLL
jgi:hypothetical protein